MNGNFSRISKIRTFSCIAAAAVILGGCQATIDSKVRSNLGIKTTPPNISYQTNDPELKTYLSLFASLENDLQGVLGKEYDADVNNARLKRIEDSMREGFKSAPSAMSASQKLAFIEKTIEDIKRQPVPHYLSVIPVGADAISSSAGIDFAPESNNQTVERKNTRINVNYKFSSAQEMSEKAYAIVEKFRPVFLTEQGWKFQDPVAFKNMVHDNYKNIDAIGDPDRKQQFKVLHERNIKTAEAGESLIQYQWTSDYRTKYGSGIDVQVTNQAMIFILPIIEPKNGQYTLVVGLSRSTAQAKNK